MNAFSCSLDVDGISYKNAVLICKNRSETSNFKANGITYHQFPRDKHRRKKWEIAVNREQDWVPTDFSTVCSEHFDAKDFYLTESGLRRLSGEAVPIINISPCEEQQPTIQSEVEHVYVKSTDSKEIIKLKYKVRRLEVLAARRKKLICQMWQKKKRMQKELDRMKCIIEHLIQNKRGNT